MKLAITTSMALVSLLGCTGLDGSSAVSPDAAAPSDGRPASLSDAERARLVFLREEEKLARDVYVALDGYGVPFTNIQRSEQRHFDSIGALLTTYELEDPAAGLPAGAFSDPTLQALYRRLVTEGVESQLAALGIGCSIEELDLHDLDVALAATTHADVEAVYDDLSRGSRNHLRAFHGRLTAAGGSYAPVYLDQATFDAIVGSPQEPGGGS